MISILYTRTDSIYNQLGVDCWDIIRDARKWPGGNAVVAHPPCRAWGQLAHFAKPRPNEKQYAIDCIALIRKNGGVLEHPRASKLWKELNLPVGNEIDEFGGFTLCVNQSWWGHRAEKKTLLYICGCKRAELPEMPIKYDLIEFVVSSTVRKDRSNNYPRKKRITKAEREATPLEFAKWLIEVAKKCNNKSEHEL